MRFYKTFPIMLNEIQRELKEMGISVHTKSVQNKNIEGDPDFDSMELHNYQYLISSPDRHDIPLKNIQWCAQEFEERIWGGIGLNPGEAWKLRYDIWDPLLNKNGKFDYTYSERMSWSLTATIQALTQDHETRRAFLPIFSISDDQSNFDVRIPCSLGYWFYFRQGKLNMTYLQRSADFSEHFNNDIWLAFRLQEWMAEQCKIPTVGTFSHWIGSLHVFAKDVENVF